MAGDARRWKAADYKHSRDSALGSSIDDYRIEKKIGQGATGAVHKALALKGPLHGRIVAIKTVRSGHSRSAAC